MPSACPAAKSSCYPEFLPLTRTTPVSPPSLVTRSRNAIARHGGERVSQGLARADGPRRHQVALARNDPRMVQSVTSLLGAGAAVGLLLPWSRAQESEADHLGLVYMAKAGYHPSAARDLWVRMAQAERSQGRPLEFLSTHPAPKPGFARSRAGSRKPSSTTGPARAAQPTAFQVGIAQPRGQSAMRRIV